MAHALEWDRKKACSKQGAWEKEEAAPSKDFFVTTSSSPQCPNVSVPQDCVLGLLVFSIHILSHSELIQSVCLKYHLYDDEF